MADKLLIKDCRLLGENGVCNPLRDIVVTNGAIATINDCGQAPPPGADILEGKGRLLLPGLINTHCHSPMILFRGLADDLPLMTWLNEYIFPAEARLVNAEMAYLCGRLAGVEMLLTGITTVADAYFHAEDAARGLIEAGMRVVSAQGIIDFPAPGVPDPDKNIAAAAEFLSAFKPSDLATPAIFCHSPYTCGPETLKKAKALARSSGCLFFIHLAETEAELTIIKKEHDSSPGRYLNDLRILDRDTVLVHCVHLDDEEIRIIAENGAAISICPRSNMKLASGIAPVDKFLDAGIRVGLGTDSAASNNALDILLEMDMAAKSMKTARDNAAILPARDAFAMATTGGADCLGLGEEIGRIEAGMRADMIIIDTDSPSLTPQYHGHSLLTYSACGRDVTDVIVNGRVVIKDRVPTLVNIDTVMAAVHKLSRTAFPYQPPGPRSRG